MKDKQRHDPEFLYDEPVIIESEVEPFMSEDALNIEYIPHSLLTNNI